MSGWLSLLHICEHKAIIAMQMQSMSLKINYKLAKVLCGADKWTATGLGNRGINRIKLNRKKKNCMKLKTLAYGRLLNDIWFYCGADDTLPLFHFPFAYHIVDVNGDDGGSDGGYELFNHLGEIGCNAFECFNHARAHTHSNANSNGNNSRNQ